MDVDVALGEKRDAVHDANPAGPEHSGLPRVNADRTRMFSPASGIENRYVLFDFPWANVIGSKSKIPALRMRCAKRGKLVNSQPLPPSDNRHRRVPQALMVEYLLLHGFAFEMARGGCVEAKAECVRAIDRWIALGLGYARDAQGECLFDPVEVTCFLKWAGVQGYDHFWQDHWIRTGRQFVDDLARSAGEPRFQIKFRRRFDLARFRTGSTVRLRAPLPLGSPYHREIQIARIVAPVESTTSQAEGRLEVRLIVSAERNVTIGADYEIVALIPSQGAGTDVLDAKEKELYLRPLEDLIKITPKTIAIAERIAGNAPAADAVNAFWNFVLDSIHVGAVRYDELSDATPVEQLFEHGGWSDCKLAASLFISLCRARGIPARLIGGNFLYRLGPSKHYWAEAWIEDRWRQFDFFGWDLSAAGQDSAWRERFAGQTDYRLVTECFPRLFTGPMSVRFPSVWQMLERLTDDGLETAFVDAAEGSLLYADTLTVVPIDN